MAPKRSAAEAALETTAQEELKKHKSAVDEAFNELLCPITQSLPIDPVTAKDGRVYERSAITKWLKTHRRSPMTNEAMGTELVPAVQVKNMIRKMIESGTIAGAKADAWKEKLAEEEEVAPLRRLRVAVAEGSAADASSPPLAWPSRRHLLEFDLWPPHPSAERRVRPERRPRRPPRHRSLRRPRPRGRGARAPGPQKVRPRARLLARGNQGRQRSLPANATNAETAPPS